MSIIEQRVVSLDFDNAKFSSGVKDTMSMLDRLKSAFSFKGSTAGIDAAQTAVNRFSVQGVISGIQNVSSQFSILGMTAANVLGNVITGQLQNLQAQMSTFTTAPIREGLAEYELNMGSIQTILTNTESKGSTLADVTKNLDELNHYADMTTYSFSEMTKNIGTFTAAGVGLEDATTAIKGLSNLGAASGSNAQQVATAMYQMSQALATGKVTLMDWNSLVNAGMGGELMKNALIETSRAMGTGVDAAIEKYGSFRDSLTSGGWLTSDVLATTFKNFSGDATAEEMAAKGFTPEQIANIQKQAQMALEAATVSKTFSDMMSSTKETLGSGWAETWKILIGDFEEGKKLWTAIGTELSDTFSAIADKRNNFLKLWKDLGGRAEVLQNLADTYLGIKGSVTKFMAGYSEMLPAMAPEKLVEITGRVSGALKNLIPSEETDRYIRIFGGSLGLAVKKFTETLGPLGQLFGDVFRGFKQGLDYINPGPLTALQVIFDTLAKVTDKIGSAFYRFGEAIKHLNRDVLVFNTFVQVGRAFASTFKVIGAVLGEIFGVFRNVFNSVFSGSQVEQIRAFLLTIEGVAMSITDFNLKLLESGAIERFGDFLETKLRAGAELGKKAIDALGDAVGAFFDFLGRLRMPNIFDTVITWFGFAKDLGGSILHFLGGVLKGVGGFFGSFESMATGVGRGIGAMFEGLGAGIGEAIEGFTSAFTDGKIGSTIDMINLFVAVLSAWGLKEFIGKGSLVSQIKDAILGNDEDEDEESFFEKAKARVLGRKLDSEKSVFDQIKEMIIGDGGKDEGIIGGVKDLISEAFEPLTDTLATMQATLNALTLLQIAAAVGVLVTSVVTLAAIDPGKLTKALVAIGALFAMLAGAMAALTKANFAKLGATLWSVGGALFMMATAISIMATAIKKLADIKLEDVAKGLAAIAVVTYILVKAMLVIGASGKKIEIGALVLTTLAFAIKTLASAIAKAGENDLPTLAKGLATITAAMVILIAPLLILAKYKVDIEKSTASLMVMALALTTLSAAIILLGKQDLETLGKGVGAVLIMVVALTAPLKKMGAMEKDIVRASAALILIATAINVLAGAVLIMGNLSWGEMARGLITMAASLYILTKSVDKIDPKDMKAKALGLMAISGAVYILAQAMATMGGNGWGQVFASLVTLGGTMVILAVGLRAMEGTLKGSLGLSAAATALALLLPALALLGSLPLPVLGKAIGALAISLGILIAAGFGASVAGAGLMILAAAITAIGIAATAILGGLAAIIASFSVLLMIMSQLPDNGAKALDTLKGIIPGLIGAIGEGILQIIKIFTDNITAVIDFAKATISGILEAVKTYIPVILEMLGMLVAGVLGIVQTNLPVILDIVGTFINGVLTIVRDNVPIVLEIVGSVLSGVLNLIIENAPLAAQAFLALITACLTVIRESVPQFIDTGLTIIRAFLDGIVSLIPDIVATGMNIIISVLDGINQKLPDVISKGTDIIVTLVQGIADAGVKITNAAADALVKFLNGFADAVRNKSEDIKKAGANVAGAIIDGITGGLASKASDVFKGIGSIATGSIDKFKEMLGIKSPSRVFKGLAKHMGEGLVWGLEDSRESVNQASGELGEGSIRSMQDALNQSLSLPGLSDAPVIKPVLDLSAVERDAKTMGDLLKTEDQMVRAGFGWASSVRDAFNQNASKSEVSEPKQTIINYTQNNTSPKALSEIDIYRQTNNQISMLKEAIHQYA